MGRKICGDDMCKVEYDGLVRSSKSDSLPPMIELAIVHHSKGVGEPTLSRL
jgi:hypothetical protein